MQMKKFERLDWLKQINRIHQEEMKQRYLESEEEMERLLKMRDDEE